MAAPTTGDAAIKRAVEEYAGGVVLDLEVYPDQENQYAVRAVVKPESGNPMTLEFLLRSGPDWIIDPWCDLEEVTFTEWPPVRRV